MSPTAEHLLSAAVGTIRLRRDADLMRARGLRYATAQRFQPCQPLPPSRDIVNATQPGAACPQLPSRFDPVTGPLTSDLAMNEDCLTVSVTAPWPDGHRRPVMVFLHGGAYVSGSGQAAAYDLSPLVRDGDVVAVSVNYRLGIFGYLAIVGVAPANLGLLDQIAALTWIQDNIAAFGGDPQNVTMFGQSAGADSISYLMVADGAENLFRRAILQSPPLGIQRGRAAMSQAMGSAARAALGPDPQHASIEEMLAAQTVAAEAARTFSMAAQMPFGPQTGHHPLPAETDIDQRRRQAAPRLPLMIGSNKDDALPFLALNPRLGPLLNTPGAGQFLRHTLGPIATGRLFRRPALALARQHRRAGGHALTYQFDWRPTDGPYGACHCVELPFLTGSENSWVHATMLGVDAHRALTRHGPPLRKLWARIAHGAFDAIDAHLQLPGVIPEAPPA
jgi:para-nitrobenzyl esterase